MNTQNINLILNFARVFENIAVVNSPALFDHFTEGKLRPNLLGVGPDFETKAGFRPWSLGEPTYIEESYEILVVEISDNLEMEKQFNAIQILAKFDLDKPVILVVPEERKLGVKKAFSPFGLLGTSLRLELEDEHFVVLSNWELSE